jgi:hypothetical protein
MRAGCTNCTAARSFPNQGRELPPHGHAAKFGGAHAPRPTRCPTDAPVKFTPLAPAVLPLEVAPPPQGRSERAAWDGASGRSGARLGTTPLRVAGEPSLSWVRPSGSACNPRRGMKIGSHWGSVRLDTPLFSGRVEEAKNIANPGASEICHQLRQGLVPGWRAVADKPHSPVRRRDWGRLLRAGEGIDGEKRAASRSPGAGNGARGAQNAVHERVSPVTSQGWRSEGSFSQGALRGDARHRLCTNKRGEATHHGAEPVCEEKVE